MLYILSGFNDGLLAAEPKIQVLTSTSVLLEWDNPQNVQFFIEYCKLGSGEWTSPKSKVPVNGTSYTVDGLVAGETYR